MESVGRRRKKADSGRSGSERSDCFVAAHIPHTTYHSLCRGRLTATVCLPLFLLCLLCCPVLVVVAMLTVLASQCESSSLAVSPPTVRALLCHAPLTQSTLPSSAHVSTSSTSTRKRSRSGRYTAVLVSSHMESRDGVKQQWQSDYGEEQPGEQLEGRESEGAADGGSECESVVDDSEWDGELQVLSVHRAVPRPLSSAARRAAEARQWEERWRDKQWRLTQIRQQTERDTESDADTCGPHTRPIKHRRSRQTAAELIGSCCVVCRAAPLWLTLCPRCQCLPKMKLRLLLLRC